MPPPRVSLQSFLSSAKTALNTSLPPTKPLTFIIGNESADLDSLCSAVVLAYLRTSTSRSNTLYIPLSNLPSADLSLRPELIPVLSHANLKPSDLITLSDLPSIKYIASNLPPEKTSWITVDHNALQGDLGRIYESRVVGCVDHHVEEGILPKDCGDEPRVVKKSGSCSTLVVEYCREAWDKLPKTGDKEVSAWNSELARLALAPILIDTANFTMESVVTPADAEIAEYLESMITPEPGRSYKRKEYFQEVFDAKQDISRLSLYDILRKDYKQWDDSKTINLGISSVVKGFQFLLEKAGSKEKLNSEMEKFAEERGLSLFSVLTVLDQHNKLKRELLVLAMNEKGVDAVKRFESTGKDHLGLEAWGDKQLDIDGENQSRRCWQQERTQNGRKQVAPLLREAIGQV